MGKKSAGLLMYRRRDDIEVLLIHPGGPFWKNKDVGAWSIPKGQYEGNEAPLDAARREFHEETGFDPPETVHPLAPITQPGGKEIQAWACEGDADTETLSSNTFSMEWPPGSGTEQMFPEADRAAWFTLKEARRRILPAQVPLLDELERFLAANRT